MKYQIFDKIPSPARGIVFDVMTKLAKVPKRGKTLEITDEVGHAFVHCDTDIIAQSISAWKSIGLITAVEYELVRDYYKLEVLRYSLVSRIETAIAAFDDTASPKQALINHLNHKFGGLVFGSGGGVTLITWILDGSTTCTWGPDSGLYVYRWDDSALWDDRLYLCAPDVNIIYQNTSI
jgi:hypothetical protein